MRFTVVAAWLFSLHRAFGFRLAASSLMQLSIPNSLIGSVGLEPTLTPASPAHALNLKWAKRHPPDGLGRLLCTEE